MMSNLLENLNLMISSDTETLSVLPKKSKKDIAEYLARVEELRHNYKKLKKAATDEINERYHRIIRKSVKQEVSDIKNDIDNFNDLKLLNNDITSFEKMGLDEVSYNLKHFYKNDLNLINIQILSGVKAFEECNIKLSEKDFNYNQYTYQYMKCFFNERNNIINSESIKEVFEDIYWKCSNIMKYINLNIYYLYFKNQKEIDKFFKNKKSELLKKYKMNSNDIIEKYGNLKEDYYKKYNSDEYVLLSKFTNENFDINRYTDAEIQSEYSKITKANIEQLNDQEKESLNDNIYKLSNSLYEYKKYLEYKNIINDMKQRNVIASKTEYNLSKEYKKISDVEHKLMKLNSKIAKGKSNKIQDKCDEMVQELNDLYEKFEESRLNSKIKKLFTDNATIYEFLSLASNNYSYFCSCITKDKTEEELQEFNKKEMSNQLNEFLLNPQFNIFLKNVRINDEGKIEQIIQDRYYLFNIDIKEENLKEENLDNTIDVVNKIVLYNNIKSSAISVQDIKFMCELKRISGK